MNTLLILMLLHLGEFPNQLEVVELKDECALARGGLALGDLVDGYRIDKSHVRPLRSVLEWFWLKWEWSPTKRIELSIWREGHQVFLAPGRGRWESTLIPALTPDRMAEYEQGAEAFSQGNYQAAIREWNQLADRLNPCHRAWLLTRLADAMLREGRIDEALQRLDEVGSQLTRPLDHLVIQGFVSEFLFKAKLPLEGVSLATDVAETCGEMGETNLAQALMLHSVAASLISRDELVAGERALMQAIAILESEAPGSARMAELLFLQGLLANARRQYPQAASFLRSSADILRSESIPLALAGTLNTYAGSVLREGKFAEAQAALQEAIELLDQHRGDPKILAMYMGNQAALHLQVGQFDQAAELLDRVIAVHQSLDPHSTALVAALSTAGTVARYRGDLGLAETHTRNAYALASDVAPTQSVAILQGLSRIASDQGHYDRALALCQRALEIERERSTQSPQVASLMMSTGNLLFDRGELDLAERCYRDSLQIREQLLPNSLDVAHSYQVMGRVLLAKNLWQQARNQYERAERIFAQIASESTYHARSLSGMAMTDLSLGNREVALNLAHRAQTMIRRSNPGSLGLVHANLLVGDILLDVRAFDEAQETFESTRQLVREIQAGTSLESAALVGLARSDLGLGKPQRALKHYLAACDIIAQQFDRLGGSALTVARFADTQNDVIDETINLLLVQGDLRRAFELTEFARSWFVDGLARARHLGQFLENSSGEWRDKRQRLVAQHQRLQLAQISGTDELGQEELENLDRLRQEYAGLVEQMREASVDFGPALTGEIPAINPVSFSLAAGDLLLSYVVMKDEIALFVLCGGEPLRTAKIAVSEEQLEERVSDWLRFVALPKSGQARSQLNRLGDGLAKDLLGIVQPELARSKRLFLITDGPLNRFPFGVLRSSQQESGRYLAESHKITRLHRLADYHSDRREAPIAIESIHVFANPDYPDVERLRANGAVASVDLSGATRDRVLTPLPGSKQEALAIQDAFGTAVTLHLGPAANESALMQTRGADVLHFACHGMVDHRYPLDSSLYLTIAPGPDANAHNGILQASEVLEQLQLNARLVVMSSCSSARGGSSGDQGLVGLSSAFQAAGAQSVIGTLWEVNDASMSSFMSSFYQSLKATDSVATALQTAQMESIRSPDRHHPYYWGSVQLLGKP